MSIPTNWYEDFFQGLFVDLWRRAIPPEMTEAEVEFLLRELAPAPGARLLDVPCGAGRHAIPAARRGYQVTGVDLSEEFLSAARKGSTGADDRVEWVRANMLELPDLGPFDGAWCMGNSFGYCVHADSRRFLAGVARSLKPGTRFVLNSGTVAEALLPNYRERIEAEIDGRHFGLENRYVAERSCLEGRYLLKEGETEQLGASLHWVYTAGEIGRMLSEAGLEPRGWYGGVDGKPFALGDHELFVVAERVE
jgi:SAM-dependent methyltransferase